MTTTTTATFTTVMSLILILSYLSIRLETVNAFGLVRVALKFNKVSSSSLSSSIQPLSEAARVFPLRLDDTCPIRKNECFDSSLPSVAHVDTTSTIKTQTARKQIGWPSSIRKVSFGVVVMMLSWTMPFWFSTNDLSSLFFDSPPPPPSTVVAHAAPPIAIIAEELGYIPVRNRNGDVIYLPKRISRPSTQQAIVLAQVLQDRQAMMVGTYWCPHTSHQKEIFGKEAFELLSQSGLYIECAPQGYGYDPALRNLCMNTKIVQGYPTWIIPNINDNNNGGSNKANVDSTKKNMADPRLLQGSSSWRQQKPIVLVGERSLNDLAVAVGFTTFDDAIEEAQGLPPAIGAGACR